MRSDQGVEVRSKSSGFVCDTIEHFFAALAGLKIRRDLEVSITGDEMPLLDGGALEFCRALDRFSLPLTEPELEVTRKETLTVGGSRYEFAPATDSALQVEVVFPNLAAGVAYWDGSRKVFRERLAPARTFGFARSADELRNHGRAGFVDPRFVWVLDSAGRSLFSNRSPDANQLAAHKLLDLLGDWYLYGGPPRGKISVFRPGHQANHEALLLAKKRRIVAPQGSTTKHSSSKKLEPPAMAD